MTLAIDPRMLLASIALKTLLVILNMDHFLLKVEDTPKEHLSIREEWLQGSPRKHIKRYQLYQTQFHYQLLDLIIRVSRPMLIVSSSHYNRYQSTLSKRTQECLSLRTRRLQTVIRLNTSMLKPLKWVKRTVRENLPKIRQLTRR